MAGRRAVIAGGAGVLVLTALGYRAWDRGALGGTTWPAYAAWEEWRGHEVDGNRRPLRAAILAASPHDTQPWRFAVATDTITVYADRTRHLGAFDPFRGLRARRAARAPWPRARPCPRLPRREGCGPVRQSGRGAADLCAPPARSGGGASPGPRRGPSRRRDRPPPKPLRFP
jgi:hypothetical protein